MPQFSQWTRPQRHGLFYLILLFIVAHLVLFYQSKLKHSTAILPFPDHLIAKRDFLFG